MVFLDVPLMQQPEAYIGNAGGLFDASGRIVDDARRASLEKFMQAFGRLIERFETP
jgi:chromate reductase